MFRRSSIVLVGALLALTIGVAPASAATGADFAGRWQSTDTDGSHQTLVVSRGATPSVVYQDFYARGCDNAGEPTTHWTAAGQGMVDGDTLWVEFHKSGCGRFLQGGYGDWFIFDAASGSLVDSFGITWFRE